MSISGTVVKDSLFTPSFDQLSVDFPGKCVWESQNSRRLPASWLAHCQHFSVPRSSAYPQLPFDNSHRSREHAYSPKGIFVSPIQNRLLARASIPGPNPVSRARAS
jgi:hypothetical protein